MGRGAKGRTVKRYFSSSDWQNEKRLLTSRAGKDLEKEQRHTLLHALGNVIIEINTAHHVSFGPEIPTVLSKMNAPIWISSTVIPIAALFAVISL